MTRSSDGLGEGRFGVFSAVEADAAGMSARDRRALLRTGRLVRLRRGIYISQSDADLSAGDPALGVKVRAAAATLAVRRYAVASHETAAVIHGLEPSGPSDGTIHLTHPRTVTAGVRGFNPGVLTHCAGLPETHVWQVGDLPVTSVARTLADLARRRDARTSLPLIDSALRQGKVSLPTLQKVFGDCGTWPGYRRAASVLCLADPKAESVFESLSRLMFVDQRLPLPESQVSITDETGFIGRVDFLWRAPKVIGEADGLAKYTEPKVLRLEKVRQKRLERLGYRVVRWLWHELRDAPHLVAARLRTAGVS